MISTKQNIIALIVLIIVLIIGLFFGYLYNQEQHKKIEHVLALREQVDYVPQVINESNNDTIDCKEKSVPVVENNPKPIEKPSFPEIQNIEQSYIISISAFSKKTQAQGKVDQLAQNGHPAKFIWIPDYQPNGKKLFKVYVGAFSSYDLANQYLKENKLPKDAYIQKITK